MDAGTLPANQAADPKALHKAQLFAETLVHLVSLLHAVALQHLRSDWELANLIHFHASDPPPPLVGALLLHTSCNDLSLDATVIALRLLQGPLLLHILCIAMIPNAAIIALQLSQGAHASQCIFIKCRINSVSGSFVGCRAAASAMWTSLLHAAMDTLHHILAWFTKVECHTRHKPPASFVAHFSAANA